MSNFVLRVWLTSLLVVRLTGKIWRFTAGVCLMRGDSINLTYDVTVKL